jgi:hypothetical protein
MRVRHDYTGVDREGFAPDDPFFHAARHNGLEQARVARWLTSPAGNGCPLASKNLGLIVAIIKMGSSVCRPILWRRKSLRFARTSWWSGGDSN